MRRQQELKEYWKQICHQEQIQMHCHQEVQEGWKWKQVNRQDQIHHNF
jgi:hypothetical protein